MKIVRHLLALLLAATAAHAGPPILQSISFSEETLDISSGNPATTEVTMEISSPDGISSVFIQALDSEFEFAGFSIYLEEFGENLERTSGDDSGGTYSGRLELPPFRPGGQWQVLVTLDEENGDQSDYSVFDLAFPGAFDGILDVTNTGTIDTAPPEVSLLAISPSTADVTSTSQTVTFRVEASDDTGIDSLVLEIYDDKDEFIDVFELTENRTSGTATDGTYEFTTIVPARSAPATWFPTIRAVDLSNRSTFFGTYSDDPPFPGASDQQLEIINNGAVDTPPTLVSFTATPASIDVSGGAETIALRAEATDVGGIQTVSVSFEDDTRIIFVDLQASSTPDIYEGTLTVPATLPPGVYGLVVQVTDVTDTTTFYSSIDEPFPAGSTTTITVANTSPADTTPPTLGTVTFSPNPFPRDTPLPATISVTISATDDLSGIFDGFIDLSNATRDASFGSTSFTAAERTSGDALSGTYSTDITITTLPAEDTITAYIDLFDTSTLTSGGQATLPISEALTYAAWLAQNPSIPAGETAPTDDPDADTLPNAIEFALGLDPTTPDPAPAIVLTPTTIGLALPANLPATTATLTTQSSPDLTTWTDLPGTTAPRGLTTSTFLRLAATVGEQ